MNVTQAVEGKIKSMPVGQLFGYRELPQYTRSPDAVAIHGQLVGLPSLY